MSLPGQLLLLATGCYVELEEDDVPVQHCIVLPLLPVLASRLDSRLRAQLMQLIVVHHLSTDEAPLKVCVDGPCCLRRFGGLADLPALHLILSRCEEVNELDGLEAGGDDLGQRADCLILFELGGFLIIRHVKYFGFHDAAEGDDGLAPMLLHPLEDLGEPL